MELDIAECLAVALGAEVELDPMAGRVLAWLQAPVGGVRPSAGLVASAAGAIDGRDLPRHLGNLYAGRGLDSGLLQLAGETATLPESPLRLPVPLALALRALPGSWPGIRLGMNDAPQLPESVLEAARRYAGALGSGPQVLAIRSGNPREARAVACCIVRMMGAEAACFEEPPAPGLGPWLRLRGCLPVLCQELAPGEQRSLPRLPGHGGPFLIATGLEGSFEHGGVPVAGWRLSLPEAPERQALWRGETGDRVLAERLALRLRHGPATIQSLARAGRLEAAMAGEAALTERHILAAGRSGAAADLGSLAQLLPEAIPDEALVVPAAVARELEALLHRCRNRDRLVDGLGPALGARYRPGVRALLHGPSGTGKSLAVGWLATRIGLPLYRVELASVTSKYIGETEKNLAQLFARAEHTEVVLLFDEADALFSRRTDGREANDRFANAQTNYLLQRIESFEGIALLASNNRARFDSAFTRRLDAIIEFPMPAAEERRALWRAHLGGSHGIESADLNRLAAGCDLAGGHIRNAVLVAAASARQRNGTISSDDLLTAVAGEYRKLGKPLPQRLVGSGAA